MKRSTPSFTFSTTSVKAACTKAFSRIIVSLILCMAFSTVVHAQVARYQFSQSTGTYSSIVGSGTALSAAGWDDDVIAATIPFSFTFNGTAYTACSVNSNGYITFGSTLSNGTGYTPISVNRGYAGAVSAFGGDQINSSGSTSGTGNKIYTATIGSSPNRVFVIEWVNAKRYSSGSLAGDTINYQIRLNETTNVVEVMYGRCVATSSTSCAMQVGLRGSSNTDYNNRLISAAAANWSKTDMGTANSSSINTVPTLLPSSGLDFKWAPAACAVPTSLTTSGVTASGATLGWTASASTPSGGYEWKLVAQAAGSEGTALFNGSVGAGVVTATASGLSSLTAYSLYVRSNCGSTFSSWAGPSNFTTLNPCGTVTSSAATSVTSSGATANWSGGTGSYIIEYGLSGFTPGTGATAGTGGTVVTSAAGTTSLALTGLTANTTYQYYVRQVCSGPTYSNNSTVQSFSTPCAAVNVPYTENFQSVTTPAIPTCTSVQTVGSSNSWVTASPANYGFNDIALRYSWSTTNAANTWWYTKGLNLTAGTSYRVAYKYGSAGYTESLEVKYGTSAAAANMTLPLATHASITTSPLANYVDFTPASTGVYYIGFHANSAADQFYLLLDSVSVTLSPSCLDPTSLAATSITLTGATANWSSTGTGSFIVEYGLPGFTPGTGATAGTGGTVVTAAAGSTSVAITGLSASTTYQYYVRQVCSGPSYSANSSAQTFNTLCNAISTFPWSEGFEGVTTTGQGGVFPICWSFSNPTGIGNPGVDNQTYTGTTYGGPHGGTKFVFTQYNDTCWFFTPQFQLTGGNTYTFSFWLQNKVPTTPVDFLVSAAYGISNTPAAMTNVLLSNYSVTNSSYQQFSYTFTAPSTGTFNFGIKSASATSTPWALSFDDFGLVELPNCTGTPTAGTASLSTSGAMCAGASVTMTVAGYANQGGITLQWQSSPAGAGSWSNISGANSASYTTTPATSTDYRCLVTCTYSSASATTNVVTQVVNNPTITGTTGAAICGPGTATLTATTGAAADTACWYATNTSTTVLGRGASYTTPTITGPTTYYVLAQSPPGNTTVGQTYSGTDNNSTSTGNHGIMFTTTGATTILSVKVPFTGTGTMTIAVRDASNSTTYSTVTTGTVTGLGTTGLTIPVNLSVPAAGNYTLIMTGITGTIGTLGYTATNSFPYSTSTGDFSITSGYWYGTDVDNLYFFNLVVSSKCASARTPVTVTYTAPPSISVTPATTTLCSGDSVQAIVTGPAYTTFSWTPTAGASPATGTTVWLKPTSSTTYTVNASGASGGCINSATVAVTVNPLPPVFAVSPSTATLCSGTIQSLSAADTATSQLVCGTQAVQNGPATSLLGASTDWPAPYSLYYGGQKMQVLILASELSAAGFSNGSSITSVQFPVVSFGSGWPGTVSYCNNFRVKMGLTTATSLSTFITSGLTVVAPQSNFTPTVGYNNTHTFTTPFVWDGTSNVILETNFSNNITGQSSDAVTQYNTPTTFASCLVYRVDGVTPATINSYSGTPSYVLNTRPDFKLNGSAIAPITWSPSTELYTDAAATVAYTGAAANTVYAKPTTTRTYTATATMPVTGCTRRATSVLTVSTPSTAPTAITGTTSICSGSNTTLTATGGTLGTGASYVWGTGTVGSGVFQTSASATATVTPSSTTTYWVSVSGVAPCGSPAGSATQSVTVATPSTAPTSITGAATVCSGSGTTLTAAGGSLSATGSYVWGTGTVGSNVFQTSTSATATVTPTSATTYWVSVSDVAPCGSPAGSATRAVTVQQAATALANTAHTATINNNTTYTLHGIVTNNVGYTWSTNGQGTLSATGTLTPVYTPAPGENGTIQIILTANSAAPCTGVVSDTFFLTLNATSNTWIGNTSDWFTASNWTSGTVPNSCSAAAVVIPTVTSPHVYPVIVSATAQVNSITVVSGAQITVSAGQKLGVCGNWTGGTTTTAAISGAGSVELNGTAAQTVSGKSSFTTLAVNKASGAVSFTGTADVGTAIVMTRGNVTAGSAATVTLKSDASATAYLDNFTSPTAGTWTGNITVERYVATSTIGYRDISSPVSTGRVSDWAADFTVNGPNGVNCWYAYTPYPTLQYYNESTNSPTSDYYGGFISTTVGTNALAQMKGYAARLYTAPLLINTTGAPGNGTLSTSITKTNSSTPAADGWNLIGNPYPSPISWNAVKALNAGKTDGSAYLFQATGEYTGNWATWNGTVGTNGATDQISSTQGFMVLATATNSITMNNTVRVAATASPFFKTANAQPGEVRLTLSGAGNSDEIVSYVDANASAGYDAGYDAAKIAAGSSVYLSFDMPARELAINVMNQLAENTELPLKVAVTDAGDYTLTATELNTDGLTAYLKDAQTGTMANLTTTAPVLHLTGGQYYTGRYSIVFRKSANATTSVESVQENQARIYSYQNKVYIQRTNSNTADVEVTNLLGQNVANVKSTTEKTEFELPATEPWYAIVKLNEGGKVTVQKVLITGK